MLTLASQRQFLLVKRFKNYYTHTDKYGRLRRYIIFFNPVDKIIIEMEVYRQYYIGDKFEKEMKIGQWEILYSKD